MERNRKVSSLNLSSHKKWLAWPLTWLLALSSVRTVRADEVPHHSKPARLPVPTAKCPEILEGTVAVLDAKVRVLARGRHPGGPLILYWHGTDSTPERELADGIGQSTLEQIRKGAGLVVAMLSGFGHGQNTSGNAVWFDSDMAVADEVVACALEQVKIEPSRIHVMGMSAGGLQTAAFAYRRSHYVASVVTYSGGHVVFKEHDFTDAQASDPSNHFAALLFYGGSTDFVGMSFEEGSRTYQKILRQRGHFAVLCDHGKGHIIPKNGGDLAFRFFNAHPFGVSPSPYEEKGMPAAFPRFCKP